MYGKKWNTLFQNSFIQALKSLADHIVSNFYPVDGTGKYFATETCNKKKLLPGI